MKLQIVLGVALAAIVVTSIAIANGNTNVMALAEHESHHSNGMMGMTNGNWGEMHEQCGEFMGEEAHEQCEAIMKSGSCPMMQ